MTWEELKEKAKEMWYEESEDGTYVFSCLTGFCFFKDGRILFNEPDNEYCNDVHEIKSDCSYDKMLLVMEGLE